MPQQQYILNRLPIGVVMLDRDYRLVSFSQTAASLLGETRIHEGLGQTIQSLHTADARGKIEWLIEQSKQEGTSGFASMVINVPDTVIQLRTIQLKDSHGVSGYCLLLYDITTLTSQPAAADGGSLFKLPIANGGGRVALLDIDRVTFLRAEGHYTQVHEGKRHFFCGLSLSQLESRLPKERFLRVHRSYIVNLAKAESVHHEGEQLVISMQGAPDDRIPVSRGNIPRVRHLLGV